MATQYNTSFIPKKSLQEGVGNEPGKYAGRRSVHGPGFFLTVLIFVASLVAAGSLFVYSRSVQERIEEKVAQLEKTRTTFDQEEIDEFARVDARMKNAYQLVTNHQALSFVFRTLESLTFKTVRFAKVDYVGAEASQGIGSVRSSANTPGVAHLTILGDAQDLSSIALQMDELNNDPHFQSAIVTKADRSSNSDSMFELTAQLTPQFTRYTNVLNSADATSNIPPIEFMDVSDLPEDGLLDADATARDESLGDLAPPQEFEAVPLL